VSVSSRNFELKQASAWINNGFAGKYMVHCLLLYQFQ